VFADLLLAPGNCWFRELRLAMLLGPSIWRVRSLCTASPWDLLELPRGTATWEGWRGLATKCCLRAFFSEVSVAKLFRCLKSLP